MTSGRLQEVNNKRKFQTISSKSGCGRLRELVAYREEVPNIVILLENFWYSAKWSLGSGGHLREEVATRGSTVIETTL